MGFGAINTRVAALLALRRSAVEIVGIAIRDGSRGRERLPAGTALLSGPEQLAGVCPDLVVEAASRAAVATGVRRRWVALRDAFGRLEIMLDNHPPATNPRTSELTALSLVRLIENRNAALVR